MLLPVLFFRGVDTNISLLFLPRVAFCVLLEISCQVAAERRTVSVADGE